MGKFKILLSALAVAVSASAYAADSTVDCTNLVQTSQAAWHGSGTYGVTVTTADGRSDKMVETYYKGIDVPTGTKPLYQTVAVENGTYTATVFATAFNAWNGNGWLVGTSELVCDFYALSDLNKATTPVLADQQIGYTEPGTYSVTVEVTNGQLELGLEVLQDNKCEWFTIQIKSLARVTTEAEALAAAMEDAKAALASDEFKNVTGNERKALEAAVTAGNVDSATLSKLIEMFKTAKGSYDDYYVLVEKVEATTGNSELYCRTDLLTELETLLATEVNLAAGAANISAQIRDVYNRVLASAAVAEGYEGRVDCTSYITNPKAEMSTTGWSHAQADGGASIGTLANEKPVDFDGVSYTYFDGGNWGGSDWTVRFEQTVNNLPEGRYRIALMARGEDALSWYRLRLNNDENCQVNLGHNGSGAADAQYGLGWYEHMLDFDHFGGDLLISVQACAKTGAQWVSFTNFRLVKIGDLDNPVVAAYEAAVEAAIAALESEEYECVFGMEWDELYELALEGDEPETDEEYEAATAAIREALDTFVNAKPAYEAYNAANEKAGEIFDLCEDAREDLFDAYCEIMVFCAEDAIEATETLKWLCRSVLNSHALAEGVEGAVDCTDLIVNPYAANGTEGWTLATADGGASIGALANECPVNHIGEEFPYFDGGNWSGNDWTTSFEQTIAALPEGNYRLSVFARGSDSLRWFRLFAGNESTDLTHEGTGSDAHFGMGWYDHNLDFIHNGGSLTIGVQANSQLQYQWHSFTNFRLVRVSVNTGIENVSVEEEAADNTVYDLTGRRVENPGTGFYIVGGKKMFIRK